MGLFRMATVGILAAIETRNTASVHNKKDGRVTEFLRGAMQSDRPYHESPAYLSEAELSAILHARDWQQLRERASHTLRVFDVDDFMLKIDVTLSNGSIQRHALGSLPETLLNRFRSGQTAGTDPIERHVFESVLPCDWDIDEICATAGTEAYLQLRACGIKCGISVAVRTGRIATRVDFYGKAAGGFPHSAVLRANLLLLASYLHDAAKSLLGKEAQKTEALTERELECLRFSAGGKTGKEIGMILGISQRTVYFHMKNIAKKFNVYNTRHAIGRAIAVGLIKPGG
jgi:LuxR family quorum-sensing transcriptional regulator LasR